MAASIKPSEWNEDANMWIDDGDENIAPGFDPTKTYPEGSIVMYEGQLYKFTTSHTGEWNDADVEAVDIDEVYARKDGAYEGMYVGRAGNLVSESKITEKVPYLYRPSGGNADIDYQEVDEVVGVTLNLNQIVPEPEGDYTYVEIPNGTQFKENDILLIDCYGTKIDEAGTTPEPYLYYRPVGDTNHTLTYSWRYPRLKKFPATITANGTHSEGGVWTWWANKTNYQRGHLRIINLNTLFGSAIATYAFSLESGTAGAGATWVLEHFPMLKSLPYLAPNLKSVQTSAHKMVGFNHYNPATGTAKLCGGYQWQITGAYTALSYSTGETITPDSDGHFTPTDDGILTITGGDDSTTCVHLVWDESRDGEWEAYTEWNYPLDDDLTLRGIPKLDADNNLYWDGDTYHSSGRVDRNWTKVKLADLEWEASTSPNVYRTTTALENAVGSDYSAFAGNCSKYNPVGSDSSIFLNADKCIAIGGTSRKAFVRDTSCATLDAFLAGLGDAELLYKKATTVTESADPYTNPQRVDNWGTEEYVDGRTIPIPVGHSTEYGVDDKAKLESAPNIPAQDGTYVVKVQSGVASYVALITPTELPPAPTTDGTYTLKVTVSSGTATYSWT